MASVNFEKYKSAQHLKAMFKHCDTQERQNTENHSNEQINKEMSKHNLQYSKSTYKSTCKRFDDRIAYLDTLEGQNKRKDRVLCFGLEIPCPANLPDDKEEDWMKQVNQILFSRFGKDNMMNLYFHRDEKHDYADSETGEKRESRNHIHAYVVPEIGGKLNGKAFSTRKNIIDLNNQIQLMTQQQFGVDFMDGTKRKSKKSVESLKNASRQREAEELHLEAEKALKTANMRLTEVNEIKRQSELYQYHLKQVEQELNDREADITRREAHMGDLEESANKTAMEAEKALKTANSVFRECKKLHENLKFQSKSYLENPIARIQERKLVELDRNLSLAYDIANQQREEDWQYE